MAGGNEKKSNENKRHLYVDESLKTPFVEATIKVDKWNGAPNRGWIPWHSS